MPEDRTGSCLAMLFWLGTIAGLVLLGYIATHK